MKRLLIIVVIAIILITGGYLAKVLISSSLLSKDSHKNVATKQSQIKIPVTTHNVSLHEFSNKISAVGSLKANETILLCSKIPGNIKTIMVDIGDHVKKGQILLQIDETNYALLVKQAEAAVDSTHAAIKQVQAQFEQAEKEYHRATNLLREKVIPQNRFDAAIMAYQSSQEALTATKGQYRQAKAALDLAKKQLIDTRLISPISGVIVDRNVEKGQAIAPSLMAMRILDQSKLKIDINLPDTDYGQIVIGAPAKIIVDAFEDQVFIGKVTIINPKVDIRTRTFQVRIEMANQDDKLVDGMFSTVHLEVNKRMALAIPRNALQKLPGSGSYYVFSVEKDIATKRMIKTGIIGDSYAEVLDGIARDEVIVTSATGRLKTGIKISMLPKDLAQKEIN